MRILFCHRPGGAFGYITDGMINALRDKGHTVARWDGLEQSWHNFAPDVYCGASGHKQPIPSNRNNCKLAIHVNPHGSTEIKGINEAPATIKWVIDQRPDLVFGYGHESDRKLWEGWEQLGVPWAPMPTAGDRIVFKQTSALEDRQYHVVYLGGRWSYKGLTIDEYLVPILRSGLVSYRLHGWGDWPKELCSGLLQDNMANSFLNSGMIGPCISEQHTHHYGLDVPERAFKVALCGALVVHDATPAIKKMIPSALVGDTAAQFKELIIYYSRPEHQEERIVLVKKQQAEVLASHTYHHRMATLLGALGYGEAARDMVV